MAENEKHPPWCAGDSGGEHRTVMPPQVRLSGRELGYGHAYGLLSQWNPLPMVVLSVGASTVPLAAGSVVYARTEEEAENIALLLERLATASPAQMRALAKQVRAAKVAFGQPGTENTDDRD